MLKYSIRRTYFPNEYGVEAWVLIGVLGVVANGSGTCCCHLLSIVVDFMLLFDIYCFLFWVGRWYLLSTCSLYWLLLAYFLFVICGVQQTCHRLWLVRNSSQSPAYQISGWAIIPSSDWILSFTSWCLEVRTWTISFTYFSFLNTLRHRNLRIDVLCVMTSRFWG